MPLALGSIVMLVMYTWRRGTQILSDKTRRQELPLTELVDRLERKPPVRVPGTAIFLTATRKARRPRFCTASSITRCCTSATPS